MKSISLSLLIVASTFLHSCSGSSKTISSGSMSKEEKYKIKSYAGCCGCAAKFFNLYERKKIKEQIVYQYNCFGKGSVTKFIFNYDNSGSIMNCDSYLATDQNDFDMSISGQEKFVFERVYDTDTLPAIENSKVILYKNILGFRKAKEGESGHSFPFVKGGSNKILINR